MRKNFNGNREKLPIQTMKRKKTIARYIEGGSKNRQSLTTRDHRDSMFASVKTREAVLLRD